MILFGDSRQQTFTEDLKGVARQPPYGVFRVTTLIAAR